MRRRLLSGNWYGPTNPDTSKSSGDRKSTRLNSSHTVIYTLSLHDALPIYATQPDHQVDHAGDATPAVVGELVRADEPRHVQVFGRSEEHTSELQSHSDLHSFPTRRSSDLCNPARSPGRSRRGCDAGCCRGTGTGRRTPTRPSLR